MSKKRIEMFEKIIPVLYDTVIFITIVFVFLCIVYDKRQFVPSFVFLFFFNLFWYTLYGYIKTL